MKRIFDGNIYEVIPSAGNIVFSYYKTSVEGGDVLVCFKMLSLENGSITDITKNVYLLAKFGPNYSKCLKYLDNYVTAKAIFLSEGKVFFCDENGKSYLLDGAGRLVWRGEIKYRGKAPRALALGGGAFWACFDTLDSVLRLNLKTFREELRVGNTGSVLCAPKHIFTEGDTAYISSAGGKRIFKLDLNTFELSDYCYFEECVYGYIKAGDKQFVLLTSGLYMF